VAALSIEYEIYVRLMDIGASLLHGRGADAVARRMFDTF